MKVLRSKSLYFTIVDGVQIQIQLEYNLNTAHIGIYSKFHKSYTSCASGVPQVMVTHHIKYKEIHGYDETVIMPKGEHRKLHDRLRREGKCNIPPDELNRISNAAYSRGHKEEQAARYRSHKKEVLAYKKRYIKKKSLHSYTPEPRVQLQTIIQYHFKTDHIHIGTNRIYQR